MENCPFAVHALCDRCLEPGINDIDFVKECAVFYPST
jgi:hypothetical protein